LWNVRKTIVIIGSYSNSEQFSLSSSPSMYSTRYRASHKPNLKKTESVKRIEEGRWRDFCYTQPLVWKKLEWPAGNHGTQGLPSSLLHSGLCSKSHPHSPHTPLGQIRNYLQVWAELLHIGRSLFASQIPHAAWLWALRAHRGTFAFLFIIYQ